MKWEQFRNRFKKDARQQEVGVDMDALWDALEPQVDELNKEEPRRRRFIFWILFTGILSVGVGLLVVANGNKKVVLAEEQIINTKQKSDFQYSEKSEESNSIFKLENDHNNLLLEKNKSTSDDNFKLNNTITNQNASSFLNEKTEIKKENSQSKKDAENPNSKLNRSQTRANQSQKNTTSTTPEFSGVNKKSVNPNNVLDSEPNIDVEQKEIVIAETDNVNTNKIPLTDSPIELQKLPSIQLFLPIEKKTNIISENFYSTISSEKETIKDKESKKDSPKENPLKKGNSSNFKFWTGINGGASFINRSLEAKNTSANVLLQNRDKYETQLEATHYGISFGVVYKNKFQLSTGIQQTVIAERFDFNETLTTVDSILGVQILRLNFDGDTIPIMGNIPRTTTTISQLKVYNTYKMIDIPVTIGYHHTFKEKWKVGVQAGVLVNLSLKTKGGIPDETLQEVDIKTDQNNIFKSQVGLNYHFGLSIGRSFLNKLELNFSPTVRFISNDFSVQDYGISQKYTLVGGNLGLRYSF